jgi:hypothetical protein
MRKLVRDKRGRVLEFQQASAAYVNCRIEEDVLVLINLFVQDQCVVIERNFLRRLFGRKTYQVNFRKQGIGSQLLTTVIAYAKAKKLKRIEGTLEEKELALNPRLPQWHQKRGFAVAETTIFLDLKCARANDDSRYMPKG